MSYGRHAKRLIRILVKAFPQPSQKHEETVCCAGITVDTEELARLYPIRYRRLAKANQFDRFDLVEMTITRATDDYMSRPAVRQRLRQLSQHMTLHPACKYWTARPLGRKVSASSGIHIRDTGNTVSPALPKLPIHCATHRTESP